MIPLAQARELIARHLAPRPPRPLPLREARGRVLRAPFHAPHDLPAFDRSAMDGYAMRRGDPALRLRVIGEVQPGAPTPEGLPPLGPGECVRIFTGAPVPPGATQVLMQETVEREGDWIRPREQPEESHIRARGEDVRAGTLLLPAGQRLRPAELSLLAHLGHPEPLVSPAPRVFHLVTGRELVEPGQAPGPGEIRDSNSILMATLLDAAGARLTRQARCGDALEALRGQIEAVEPETWDMLLLSGGASVGDYDFGARVLRELGFTLHFEKIALRPGKPLIFATRGPQAAFVLPGNPLAHFVLFHVAIQAALAALEGAVPPWPLTPRRLAAPLPGESGPRETWWPARLEAGGLVRPLAWQSSGDLTGLIGAEALLRVEAGAPARAAGEEVPCWPLA